MAGGALLSAVVALVGVAFAYRRARRAETSATAARSEADRAVTAARSVTVRLTQLEKSLAALEVSTNEPRQEPWRVDRGSGADPTARVVRQAPTAAHSVSASAKDKSGHYTSDNRNSLRSGETLTLRLSAYSQRAETTIEVAWSENDGARKRWTGTVPPGVHESSR